MDALPGFADHVSSVAAHALALSAAASRAAGLAAPAMPGLAVTGPAAARAAHQLVSLASFPPLPGLEAALQAARSAESSARETSSDPPADPLVLAAAASSLAESCALLTERISAVAAHARSALGAAPQAPAPAAVAAPFPVRGSSRTVLVVEDDPVARALLVPPLAAAGFAVSSLVSGEEAAAADPDLFDVVVLDVDLPGRDGHSVLAAWNSRPSSRRSPRVVLSARSGPADRARSLGLGASAHLAKPISPERLLAVLEGLAPL